MPLEAQLATTPVVEVKKKKRIQERSANYVTGLCVALELRIVVVLLKAGRKQQEEIYNRDCLSQA